MPFQSKLQESYFLSAIPQVFFVYGFILIWIYPNNDVLCQY